MTAVEISTADTAAIDRRARTAADIAAVLAARAADERLTEGQLVTRCRWVVGRMKGLDADTAADLTGDLLAYVGERFGWTPRKSEVTGEYLRLWALRDLSRKYTDGPATVSLDTAADAADDTAAGSLLDAERRAGVDHVTPAADPDAADLAQALECTPAEADAITAALSGWGSAMLAGDAWGISYAAARKRLQRGRDALRARFPHAGSLAAAVTDACAITADPANPSRADIAPAARAARRAVEAVSGWQPEMAPHAAAMPDVWRGHDLPCRTVDHRQHVPALPARAATSPGVGDAGRVPATLRSGRQVDSGSPADVLAYVARMERVRDALPALTRATPQAARVPAAHVLRRALPTVRNEADAAAVLRAYRLGCPSLRHLVTD